MCKIKVTGASTKRFFFNKRSTILFSRQSFASSIPLSFIELNSETPGVSLLLSTLWTMWNSCSTVVLPALLKLQERRRRRSAAAPGSQQLVGTRRRTSGSMLWDRPRRCGGQGIGFPQLFKASTSINLTP